MPTARHDRQTSRSTSSRPLNGGAARPGQRNLDSAEDRADVGWRSTPPRLPLAFDLRRLAVLREVARQGSFTSAAEILSFSPSAVSQQMATLERDVGVVLFERTPRGMRLTGAGVALLAHADAVLARLADAEIELQGIARGERGQLRIGSFTTATARFVAPAVETFRERHPQLEVSFFDGEPYESIARLRARELDLAVIFEFDHWSAVHDYDGLAVCEPPPLDYGYLFDDPLRVVVPEDHPLAASAILSFAQIANERILGSPPWARDLQAAAGRAGVELQFDSSCRVTGFEALQAFTAAGRGLTLMPELALGWLRDGLVARPLEGGPVRQIKTAMLAESRHSPPARTMRSLLCEIAARGDGAAAMLTEV